MLRFGALLLFVWCVLLGLRRMLKISPSDLSENVFYCYMLLFGKVVFST